MHFRLKFYGFELELQTPEPVQVSTADIAAVVYSAAAQRDEAIICVHEHAEDENED
jgi:hypothetical protein